MAELVSVIVPVYNVAEYLARCVGSLLAQTYPELEILLIDDGSTDGSQTLCDAYASQDARIRVVHKENGGLSDARNAGIDIARGGFLTFVDSDDWVDETFVSALMGCLQAAGADLAVCTFHKAYDAHREGPAPCPDGVYSNLEAIGFLYGESAVTAEIACCKLYRKRLFDGLRFAVGRLHEDSLLTYQLYYRAQKVCFFPEDLYHYYQREGSIVHSGFSERRLDGYLAYLEREAFFQEKGLDGLVAVNGRARIAYLKNMLYQMHAEGADKALISKWRKTFLRDYRALQKKYPVALPRKIKDFFYLRFTGLYTAISKKKGVFTLQGIRKFIRNSIFYAPLRRLLPPKHYRTAYRAVREALEGCEKPLFLALASTADNLGDHAITVASVALLQKYLPEYTVIEIDDRLVYQDEIFQKLHKLTNGKPVAVIGGGFLGTLWFEAGEKAVRHIIMQNPDSPVFLLPNTLYFEENDWGRAEKEKSAAIYNRHQNLTVFLREKFSYELGKALFPNVFLVPDAVLSLQKSEAESERTGVLLCLRNDVEKTLTAPETAWIKNVLTDAFGGYTEFNMCLGVPIFQDTREAELQKMFGRFRQSALVVTDRLHAIIFCAVTGTPCVVIPSKSPKVLGSYEWLRQYGYIRLLERLEDFPEAARRIYGMQGRYRPEDLSGYYQQMCSVIKQKTEGK